MLKVEQPTVGGSLELTDEAGNELDGAYWEDKDVDLGKQEQKVLVKISVEDGYTLNAAYNGKGDKVPLVKDDAGNYFIIVPKGGGVYLTADIVAVKHEMIEEPSTPHEIGSGEDLVYRASGSLDEVEAVTVNDNPLTEEQGEITSGSVVVRLYASFLDTLGAGDHSLKIKYLNGDILSSAVKVRNQVAGHTIPKTGIEGPAKAQRDTTTYVIAISVLLICTAIVSYKKKYSK